MVNTFTGRLFRKSKPITRNHAVALTIRVSRAYLLVLTSAIIAVASPKGNGQSIDSTIIELEIVRQPLTVAFKEIERRTNFLFKWGAELENNFPKEVSLPAGKYTVRKALEILLLQATLRYQQHKNHIMILPLEAPGKKVDKLNTSSATVVTGSVKNADTHEPLAGVNIVVKGTTKGTSSDGEGKFMIQAEVHETLVFSFIGFKSFEAQVLGGRSTVDVAMEVDASELQEVVVNAGYYDVKDKEKTGSIAKVTAEVIEKQPVTNPLGALSGRMPGVFIQQTTGIPGGDFKIEIRGRNSLRENGNEPLFIVDGVPFSSEKVSNHINAAPVLTGGASPLTSINPTDIESIEVLKDADATAIYGSRGANGVVLITTKKGKAGKTKFDFNAYVGGGRASLPKMLSTKQYLTLRREGFSNDGISPSSDPSNLGYAPELLVWDTTRYTNWPKVSMGGTAVTTSIQGSVSGGSENTQFLFTVGYRKEGSVLLGDPRYQKGSSHLSVNHMSSDKRFSINISVSGAVDRNNQTSSNANFMTFLPPNAPSLYDENGELNWENYTWDNPLALLNATYEGRTESIISNTIIGYEILRGLKVKTSFGLNSLASKELTTEPSTIYSPAKGYTSAISRVVSGSGSLQSWIIEPQLSWEKRISKGHLSALVGSTFQEQQLERSVTSYTNFPSNSLLSNLTSASQIRPVMYSKSLYRYTAIFGRLNYDWNEKYIVNFTARRDGSSRFGPGKQFANFGAVGAAWIFSRESFLSDNFSFFTFGKLRASYGTTGSDQIGDYQFFDTYSTGSSAIIYQGISGLTSTRLFNPDFAWEANQKLEGALELGFFQDRILLNISCYRNRSSNQLVTYTLPMTTGFRGILANLPATVQNTGVEVELSTVNFHSERFNWITSVNLTVPRNKLVEFPNIEASTYSNTYVVGESIYIQKLYEFNGVHPQTGLYTYKDFDGDNTITFNGDRKKAVFVGYDFFGGLNSNLEYKNWKLDVFLQFVKQTGYNYKYQGNLSTSSGNSVNALVLNEKRWRKPGDIADLQREFTSSNTEAMSASIRFNSSEGVISDASFIRLKNISLSFQFPQRWMKMITCRLYVQCQNLFVFTNYKGLDPESQQAGELGPLKILTSGIQLTF